MDGQVWKAGTHGGLDGSQALGEPVAAGVSQTLGALAASGDPGMFAGLLRAPSASLDELLDRAIDENVRALAAQALLACRSDSKAEVLFALRVLNEAALTEECPELVPEAARVLIGLCHPDQETEVLAATLPVFGWYTPGPSTAQTLLAMTEHPAPKVRAAAVEGIENFVDERTFPPATMELVQRLAVLLTEDPDAEVRLAAAGTFGSMDLWEGFDYGWVPQMAAVLARAIGADPDQRVRRTAAETMAKEVGKEHQSLVTRTLGPCIEDPDPYVAAWALARMAALGDPRALERLWAVVAAVDVHRAYLAAASHLFVFYGDARSKHRRRLRRAFRRLRRKGWANVPSDEPNWTPQARANYLKTLISSVSPWWAPWWLPGV